MKKLVYIALTAAALASSTPAYACGGIWRLFGYCVPGAF